MRFIALNATGPDTVPGPVTWPNYIILRDIFFTGNANDPQTYGLFVCVVRVIHCTS